MNKNESKYFNTAKKMNDALIALLETKEFEYITIKEICQVVNVNRTTFYLHYSNMNDLLEETIQSLNQSFNSHFITKENENIYKIVKTHPELFNASKTYNQMFNSLFVPIMSRFGLDAKWHKYLMDFYINGITSIVLDWVYDDCKISIQEVSEFIKGLIVKND